MLKTLTLSVSLAFALGASSLAFAGHHGVMASPQGSEQSVTASPQGETCAAEVCAPKKKCCFKDLLAKCKPKPKCYTYTWVLKKKKCHGGLFGGGCHKSAPCGEAACNTCGGSTVTPSGQYASPQGGEILGSGQATYAPTVYGAGQAYGAGQTYGAGQAMSSAPAMTRSAPAGDEAPPAPAMKEEAPAPPAPSTPPVPADDAPKFGSLLNLPPAGN